MQRKGDAVNTGNAIRGSLRERRRRRRREKEGLAGCLFDRLTGRAGRTGRIGVGRGYLRLRRFARVGLSTRYLRPRPILPPAEWAFARGGGIGIGKNAHHCRSHMVYSERCNIAQRVLRRCCIAYSARTPPTHNTSQTLSPQLS
jgi:hypothetical protein